MFFCHALVPLLCPFVRCRKNFYYRKAMPQTKSVIKGKPAMQNTTVSFYVLDTAQDFLGVDNRVVHSSGFVE
jgi:hypothetical protein